MKKILITTSSFGKKDNTVFSTLDNAGLTYKLNPYGRKLTQLEITEMIREHNPVGLIAGVEPLNSEVLTLATDLKVISRCGVGMDNVDVDAALDLGIAVSSTPDAPTISVAELTMGLIFSLLRLIHRSDHSIRKLEWTRPMGNLLYGKSVGIVGCGRIGSYLAKLLQPFGCEVLGCDPVCFEEDCFSLVGLEELLNRSDIITIHIPYSEPNHHLFNAERFIQMKKRSFLINTARGGIVDEHALLEALGTGHLAGAALDCFEQEPYIGPLKNLDNVLLTAHIGSYAKEGRIMMENQAVENLIKELEKVGVIK